MTYSRGIRTGAAVAVILAFAGHALAWDFIVESRSTGYNYGSYSDTGFLDSTAKSTAAGLKGTGCRYATSTTAKATYSFTAPATGTYAVHVTWATSTNGDTAVLHTVNYEGGSTQVTLNQYSGNGNNSWNSLGEFPFVANKTYTVEQTNPTKEHPSNPTGARMMADAVKWSISCACSSVPEVGTKTPHMAGDTKVRVTGIDPNATKVTVYINGISAGNVTLAGAGTSPSETDVTVAALVAGQRVNATQTLQVCDPLESKEGCVPTTGPVVGDCSQVPGVTVQPAVVAGATVVVVSGVDASAKAVKVYADGVGPAIGTLSNPVPASPDNRVSVTVSALQADKTISATQTLQSVGGSGANLEGCIPAAGLKVGDCAQVAAVSVAGMVSKELTKVRVSGVSPYAGAVRVYANDGTTDTLIGTNTTPGGASTVIITVSPALVLGQTIKATQVLNTLEGCMPATGRRVMETGIIEDFEDTLKYDYAAPTAPQNRTWYNVSNLSWTTVSQPNPAPAPFTSKAMDVIDSGWTNGVYAVYEQIIPENGKTWHIEADMLVDERGADPDLYKTFQMGVAVNGSHRSPSNILADITGIVGDYLGLTPLQEGVGVDTATQTVYTNSFTANQGDDLLIAFATSCTGYSVSKTADPSAPGMMIDNIRLVEGEPPCICGRVGPVSLKTGPIEAGQTSVTVSGISIDPLATKVTVYSYDGGDNWTKLGEVVPAAATANVPVTPLVKGKMLVATQTVSICTPSQEMEGCKGKIGPVVGLGKNTGLLMSVGIRETGATAGPVGADGGTTGSSIEWLGPTTAVGGAPQGKKVPSDPAWQTVTFTPGVDKVLSFNAGNGTLDGAWGVLEHLAFALDTTTPNSGRYTIYIDNVYSGTTLLTDFESYAAADKVLFALPNYSGTTSANLITPPNMAEVSEEEHDGATGTKSLKISFQFVDVQQKRWLRLTSYKSTTSQLLTNPLIELTQPITMRVLLKGTKDCGAIFADRDKDGDVDQVDFGEFQKCYTGLESGIASGCECFDRDGDEKIDASDLNAFTACWSGPTIAADPACDDN